MGTTMKANGRKIYSMGRVHRSMPTKTSTMEGSCVEASSGKGSISLQMAEYTKDLSITGTAMGMVS